MARPSILSSQTNAVSAGICLASRSAQASSSSELKALSRLIIGTRWATGAKSVDGAAPTVVGRRVRHDQVGVVGLDGAQLADQGVVLGVGDLRVVEPVVALVVVGDQRAQLLGPRPPGRARSPADPVLGVGSAHRGDARTDHRVGVGAGRRARRSGRGPPGAGGRRTSTDEAAPPSAHRPCTADRAAVGAALGDRAHAPVGSAPLVPGGSPSTQVDGVEHHRAGRGGLGRARR